MNKKLRPSRAIAWTFIVLCANGTPSGLFAQRGGAEVEEPAPFSTLIRPELARRAFGWRVYANFRKNKPVVEPVTINEAHLKQAVVSGVKWIRAVLSLAHVPRDLEARMAPLPAGFLDGIEKAESAPLIAYDGLQVRYRAEDAEIEVTQNALRVIVAIRPPGNRPTETPTRNDLGGFAERMLTTYFRHGPAIVAIKNTEVDFRKGIARSRGQFYRMSPAEVKALRVLEPALTGVKDGGALRARVENSWWGGALRWTTDGHTFVVDIMKGYEGTFLPDWFRADKNVTRSPRSFKAPDPPRDDLPEPE